MLFFFPLVFLPNFSFFFLCLGGDLFQFRVQITGVALTSPFIFIFFSYFSPIGLSRPFSFFYTPRPDNTQGNKKKKGSHSIDSSPLFRQLL